MCCLVGWLYTSVNGGQLALEHMHIDDCDRQPKSQTTIWHDPVARNLSVHKIGRKHKNYQEKKFQS